MGINTTLSISFVDFQALARLLIVEFACRESLPSLSHIEELVIQAFTLKYSNTSFSSVPTNIKASIIFLIFYFICYLRDATIVKEGIVSSEIPLLMCHISHELTGL
jgi:hypothetical protein